MRQIETERLVLRKFVIGDLDDFYDYARLETVGPNAGWLPHPNKGYSLKILEHFIGGDEVWAMYLKTEEKVIGSIGLHIRNLAEFGEVKEIGYVLSTAYENRGFMTEGVKAILNHAFNELNIEKIYVGHFLENRKSQKLISKFPFKYLHDEDYESKDYGLKRSKLYVMTKADFNKN
ncbi:MAG: GNAT family N-acetyltransferase [Candidatus Izemoplasmatales bacterium]|nr:GNAT family N-acetyltransferase [Candidatus Izemoplasmatales bacterium]